MQYIRFIHALFVSLMLTQFYPVTNAQPVNVPLPDAPGERVLLFTDRDLYATTEEVLFSAFCEGPGNVNEADWSQVLYVELIRWNGNRINGKKVFIDEGRAYGTIKIPADLESGNYYLRAYTKWMRNFSPYQYSYRLLKIVNPDTKVTETGPEENIMTGKQVLVKTGDVQDNIQIEGLKETYGTREQVAIEMGATPGLLDSKLLLGVVRKGTMGIPGSSFSFGIPAADKRSDGNSVQESAAKTIQFFPEIRGMTLSGKVINTERDEPAADVRVNLSTVADPAYFSTTLTDAAGAFIFTFPDIRGDHEFHIAVEDEESGQMELLIDNDFCHRPVTLPYEPFYLTGEEEKLVLELAQNAQIRSRFGISVSSRIDADEQEYPFYGAADRIIFEKEYIELKNMGEFFYELVYEVNVRRRDGNASLHMSSFGTLVSYPPLVLMDNIRIDNIDELLDVSCRRVERIEVVNRGYVIGNRFYSGIISLYSEEHDMAGMKLGEDNNFFNLTLPVNEALHFPDYSEEVPAYVPDRRNTLSWMPQITFSEEGSFSTTFYTPDVPGTYTICFTGINSEDDTLFYATREIVVEE